MKKNDVIIACCCVFDTVEMKRPIPSMLRRKRTDRGQDAYTAVQRHTEPKGTKADTRSTSKRPIRKKGTVFPNINSTRRMGVTMISSSVPISTLPHHREGGQVYDDDQYQVTDHARYKNQRSETSGLYQGLSGIEHSSGQASRGHR